MDLKVTLSRATELHLPMFRRGHALPATIGRQRVLSASVLSPPCCDAYRRGSPGSSRHHSFSLCLATESKTVLVGHGWVHEIKHDGYRMQLRKAEGRIRLFTSIGGRLVRSLSVAAGGRGGAAREDLHNRRRDGCHRCGRHQRFRDAAVSLLRGIKAAEEASICIECRSDPPSAVCQPPAPGAESCR
jgi:hypothetical protein